MTVVRHMFYGPFGTQSTMVTFIFRFHTRKGQYKVKLGQKRSNFQNQNFILKPCLSCPVLSQDSKYVIYFYVRQLQIPKIAFQKSGVIAFTRFFGDCTAKNEDIALKFGMCVVCMKVYNIYSGFLDNSKILDFISIYF